MFRSADRQPADDGTTPRLTRRELLKLGAMGAGVLVAGGIIAEGAAAEDLISGGKSVSRTTGTLRRPVASNCSQCLARCSIIGFVENGRLVKIEGNPRDPNSRGRLCARGQAGINRIYDPDRVLSPMRRTGQRGEGKWEKLTWEQAYDILESKLRAMQSGSGLTVLHTGLEGPGLMASRFVAAMGSATLLDEAVLRQANRQAAQRLTAGSGVEVVDIAHAKYVLNFGSNPYEGHPSYVPFVQRLVDARASGAKLVTFDPRMSLTAGKSDEWYAVSPGTDGLVALAMAGVILKQKLHDSRFLYQWTDLTEEQLAQHLAPYTPESAESATGIPAVDLRRVATEFASTRPAVAISGGGVEHQERGVETQRAILLLNAMVGAVGTPGGVSLAPQFAFPEPDPVPLQPGTPLDAARVVEEMLQGQKSVGLYITSMANPAYSWPDSQRFQKALQDEGRVSYLLSIDTNLTETSVLADLVLPAATYLESWGLEAPASQELKPLVSLRQPVLKARGESLSTDDILLTLGTRLEPKSAQLFPFPTLEGYLGAVVAKLPDLAKAGGLALLKENGVWFNPGTAPQFRPRSDVFDTPSGKLEFAQEMPGSLITQQAAATVSTPGGKDAEPLTLVTYRPNVHFGDYSANSWWLAEIAHDNPLLIHPLAAQARGIRQGQEVRVASATGSVQVRVRITEGINPHVVALASSFGHWQLGRVARAERFKSDDPMTAHLWWSQRGNGINVNALTSDSLASAGGLVWTDNRIRVEAMG